VAIIKRN